MYIYIDSRIIVQLKNEEKKRKKILGLQFKEHNLQQEVSIPHCFVIQGG